MSEKILNAFLFIFGAFMIWGQINECGGIWEYLKFASMCVLGLSAFFGFCYAVGYAATLPEL